MPNTTSSKRGGARVGSGRKPGRTRTPVLPQTRLSARALEDLEGRAKKLGWPVARLVRRLLESIDGLMAIDALVVEELADLEKRRNLHEHSGG